jgi:gamma-D-glutamyl-L-lysine dipeptidyl-peptidase
MVLGLMLGLGFALASSATAAGKAAYVDVGVATLWVDPGQDRAVDAHAVSDPSSVPKWQETMTLSEKQWLVGRLETQALYGQRVLILEERGAWTRVAVQGQPTPRNASGYPGWVPSRQLSTSSRLEDLRGEPFAQVETETARIYENRSLSGDSKIVGYATRLPVVKRTASAVGVATPNGDRWIDAGSVSVYRSVGAIPEPTGAQVVRTARQFLGLEYLWAGTSAFGFDCSGFTHTVYRGHGITIPRDTVSRSELSNPKYGRRVTSFDGLRKGDLLYFAYNGGSGTVHHVGMYVGNGDMIHSPRPGSFVRVDDVRGSGWIEEYAGAIRYL